VPEFELEEVVDVDAADLVVFDVVAAAVLEVPSCPQEFNISEKTNKTMKYVAKNFLFIFYSSVKLHCCKIIYCDFRFLFSLPVEYLNYIISSLIIELFKISFIMVNNING